MMKVVNIIEALPEAVFGQVLTSWVDLTDIAKLDSAVCNHAHRLQLLMTLSSGEMTHKDNGLLEKLQSSIVHDSSIGELLIDWLLLRHVGVNFLVLTHTFSRSLPLRNRYLSEKGHKITSIYFDQSRLKIDLDDLCKYCPNVEHISSCYNLKEIHYNKAIKAWPRLQYIELQGKCTDDTLDIIASCCKQLLGITSILCFQITQGAWMRFLHTCTTGLTSINLDDFEDSEQLMKVIGSRFTSLTKFTRSIPVYDDDLISLLQGCPALEELIIPNSFALTNRSIVNLAQSCGEKLIVLDISKAELITDLSIYAIAENCPNLRCLRLSCQCTTSQSLIKLGENCHNLEKISLKDCVSNPDDVIVAIAQGCPHLYEVNLEDCGDVGLQAVAKHCPLLHAVDISGCCLSGVAVTALFLSCPNLLDLNINYLGCVTDSEIQVLVDSCKKLRKLSICEIGATMEGWSYIAAHCKSLRELWVSVSEDESESTGIYQMFQGSCVVIHMFDQQDLYADYEDFGFDDEAEEEFHPNFDDIYDDDDDDDDDDDL